MSEEYPVFTVHYNEQGEPVDVTSDNKSVKITMGEFGKIQELPPNVETKKVSNTTIISGEHNPRCQYIWVPRRGWVWVCW